MTPESLLTLDRLLDRLLYGLNLLHGLLYRLDRLSRLNDRLRLIDCHCSRHLGGSRRLDGLNGGDGLSGSRWRVATRNREAGDVRNLVIRPNRRD